MRKTFRTVLKAMLSVFLIVMLLPAASKTVEAVEQSETLDINTSAVDGDLFRVQGHYQGGVYNAMFIDSGNCMIVSALDKEEGQKLIKKVTLEYSESGDFDITTVRTDEGETTDHTTFTITNPVYSVVFRSSAQVNPVLVTSVTVYYDDGIDEIPVNKVSLNNSVAHFSEGESINLTAVVAPVSATDKEVIWSVSSATNSVKLYSDEECHYPIETGATETYSVYAKGVSVGEATVTVTSNSNPEISANCDITVTSSGDFITVQPEDKTVSYPKGASFTVGVKDESKVASYQWYLKDINGSVFTLDGETAKKATLVVPSTLQERNELYFYCVITTTDGKKYTSTKATLKLANKDEDIPVYYVGEYAVARGETLDLSTKYHSDGHCLGSGTVSLSDDGLNVTLNNVCFDNSYCTAWTIGGANVALSYVWHYPPQDVEKVTVTLIGTNTIVNHFEQPEWNLAGIPFDFLFWGQDISHVPLVEIVGNGSLSVTKGTNLIRAIGDLSIETDINLCQSDTFYSDGIVAQNLRISGVNMNLKTNGSIMQASGNILIENSKITADMLEPYVSSGTTSKHGFNAHRDMVIKNSVIDFTVNADQDVTSEVAGVEGMKADRLYVTDSDISIHIKADEKDEKGFAHHFIGMYGNTVDIDNSSLGVNMNSNIMLMTAGLKGGNINIHNNSMVDVNMRGMEGTLGIYAEGELKITDSTVDTLAENKVKAFITPYALSARILDVDLNENNSVTATAVNLGEAEAVAVAAMAGPYYLHDTEHDLSYEPGVIKLSSDTICTIPENNKIDTKTTTVRMGEYIAVRTFVDTKTDAIARTVELVGKASPAPRPEPGPDLYECIEGGESDWRENSSSVLQFRITRTVDGGSIRSHFSTIRIDNREISSNLYNVLDGSLIIQLKPALLKDLSIGRHKLSIYFDDGRVDTFFNVVQKGYVLPVTGIE